VWELVQRGGDLSLRRELGSARGTLVDVRVKWCYTESDLAVEQLVEFVREQMSVVHDSSTALYAPRGRTVSPVQ
jgi:hypothetical protein